MKHFGVPFLVLLKCSQKIHNLEVLSLLMFQTFSPFCLTETIINFSKCSFFLILDVVVKE